MVSDYDAAVAIVIVMIPATMVASVMFIEAEARTAVMVGAVVGIAADAESEPLSAGDRRHRDSHRSHGGEYKLPHVPLQSLLRTEGNECSGRQFQERRRNFLEWMFTIIALFKKLAV
jgi:hypothetical protein